MYSYTLEPIYLMDTLGSDNFNAILLLYSSCPGENVLAWLYGTTELVLYMEVNCIMSLIQSVL